MNLKKELQAVNKDLKALSKRGEKNHDCSRY
jgi:hypothetical protein